MNFKNVKRFLMMVPCLLLIVGYYIYCYGNANPNTPVGIMVSSIISGYKENLGSFHSFLAISNHKGYLENVAVVEVADEKRKDAPVVSFMNNKSGVADLNNWILPISGNYVITTYYSYYHKGVDYYSYLGYDSSILAANNGVVYTVNGGCTSGNLSCNGGRGNYIVINHNNGDYYTMYMHLNNINVNVFDYVNAGDVIGTMGNTGYVIPCPDSYNIYGGTHLHFEVYIGIPDSGGYTINPLSLY